MRVVIESKRVLVVETPGRVVPAWYAVLALLHLCVLFLTFSPSLPMADKAIMAFSILGNGVFGYFVFGRLRDKITVTFHGAKHKVLFERRYSATLKEEREFTFEEFKHFEVSDPLDQGFCRLRLKNDKVFLLLRLRKGDDFSVFHHLDMLTRKEVRTIQ